MAHQEQDITHELKTRIVHIGFGAFFRAHQALYASELADTYGSNWGYCVVSLFSGEQAIRDLRAGNFEFSVAEKGTGEPEIRSVKVITEALHPNLDGYDAITGRIADPNVNIVSLTITEKGYGINPHTGYLDLEDIAIKIDLTNFENPKSAVGVLVRGLLKRYQAGSGPVSIMSCDNMPENGLKTHNAVIGFAAIACPEIVDWIKNNVTFPSTMVDRIVPAMTAQTHHELDCLLGYHDACGILCEPFRQWVIEDNFVAGRPEWEKVGVELTDNVVPYEEMKLRMLNGSHSFLAYLGYLAGYETIFDCMQDANFRLAAYRLMMEEQAPTLSVPAHVNLEAYARSLIERYDNPGVRHRTWQIAMDGSQKLPQRLLDSARFHIAHGREYPLIALAIAAWIRYATGIDEQGQPIEVRDPMADSLQPLLNQHTDTHERVMSILTVRAIFGEDLASNNGFARAVENASQRLLAVGAKQSVAELVNPGGLI